MKRLIVSLLVVVACIAVLLVPVALAGQGTGPKPPTLTLRAANRYAKKGTLEIFNRLHPAHFKNANQHTESVITYAFQGLDPCKREVAPTKTFFRCTAHFTATDVTTKGEISEEEVNADVRHVLVIVAAEDELPKHSAATEVRIRLRKPFRVLVALD